VYREEELGKWERRNQNFQSSLEPVLGREAKRPMGEKRLSIMGLEVYFYIILSLLFSFIFLELHCPVKIMKFIFFL